MSATTLNKPFKHFANSALFNAAKVSINAENTSYIQNGTVYEGTPDILWENTVFIHDIAQIWNRGRYYNSQKYLGKLSAIAKNSFMGYSGINVITLIDKNPESLYNKISIFSDYPGILPSIVIAPGTVSNIDKIIALLNKGCDALSTALNGVSVYDSTATKDDNYDEILENMIPCEQWLVEHGIFTNCYKYPDSTKAEGESYFIQRYEEYGVRESNTAVNSFTQDNMLLNSYPMSTDTDVDAAISHLSANSSTNSLMIFVMDSTSISNAKLEAFVEAIQTMIDNGSGIYMQMHEALKMRGSEMNIGRGETALPFRVYKDGLVDANLSGSTLSYFAGENLEYNSSTGKLDATGGGSSAQSDWTEDDPTASSYILNKPDDLVKIGYLDSEAFIPDFNAETDTVHITPQTLSNAQKAQARQNIGAAEEVQSDWSENDSSLPSYIQNKPSFGDSVTYNVAEQLTGSNGLVTDDLVLGYVATAYNSLYNDINANKNAQGDWSENDSNLPSYIQNKPSFGDSVTYNVAEQLTGSNGLVTDNAVKSYVGSYMNAVMTDVSSEITEAQSILYGTIIEDLNSYLDGISDEIAETVNDNAVKYSGTQNLSNAQKAQARQNIGAGTGSLDSLEGAASGIITAYTNANYTTAQVRNIIMSTAEPTSSDGNNGDVWIVYEA